MSVQEGQPVNANVTNSAFLSRKQDSNTIGKISLDNVDSPAIADTQLQINTNKDLSESNESRITINEGDIAQNASDITQNLNNIASNNALITDLIRDNKAFLYIENGEKCKWDGTNLELFDDLKIFFPSLNIVNTITSGLFPIGASEHLFVTVDRSSSATLVVSTNITLPTGIDIFRLCSRVGDNLVWYDNTLQRLNKKIRIGEGGGGGSAYQELIGTGNGANLVFPLTFFPSNATSILVFANTARFTPTEYTYNELQNQIEFVIAPDFGQEIYVFYLTEGDTLDVPAPSGTREVEYIELSLAQETAKEVVLGATPALASGVVLDLIGGTPQKLGVDYNVTGNILTWSGYALDGVLSVGDNLRVIYQS